MDIHNPEDQHSYIFQNRPMVYATFWQRFLAALIDGVVLSVVNIVLRKINVGGGFFLGIGIPGAYLVFSWLYYALQESGARQATLGKRAMGIIVANTNGNRISFGKATVRYFSKILSFIILLIGYLMMLWDDRKQTLHDKIADTVVIAG